MIVNVESNSVTNHNLNVTTLPYATVTIKKNDRVHTVVADDAGMAVFKNLSGGTWSATATSQDGNLTNTVVVDVRGDVSIEIVLNYVLDFTYSISAANGGYAVYDDNGNDITSNPVTQGNWKIKFYKNGVLTINKLNGAADGIDVFCVGGGGNGGAGYRAYEDGAGGVTGGGGGGGGGRTTTKRGVSISTGIYNVTIGGAASSSVLSDKSGNKLAEAEGGQSRPSRTQWDGGWDTARGGKGGSGGGGGSCHFETPAGGKNGGSGSSGANNSGENAGNGGSGLDASTGTKEFHESTGTLYASGGYGGGLMTMKAGDAAPNTGNGGNGGASSLSVNGAVKDHYPGTKGGSGIVIIRNKR